jgi:hypothetical protein
MRSGKSPGMNRVCVTMVRAVQVAYLTVGSLSRAWIIRVLRRTERLRLPNVQIGQGWIHEEGNLERVVKWVDLLCLVLVPFTRHRCFYQSYARAVVLRRLGIPVVLNIGLRNIAHGAAEVDVKGHCWTTLEGRCLLERDVQFKYDFFLAKTADGLSYWAGSTHERSKPRNKRRFR